MYKQIYNSISGEFDLVTDVSAFNTNWRGFSATDPLNPIAGDWYNNSSTGEIFSYDGANWIGWDTITEGFISTVTGNIISFTSTNTSSSISWVSFVTASQDLNSGATRKPRQGFASMTLGVAASARALVSVTSGAIFRIPPAGNGDGLYMLTWSGRLNNSVINFANDPVLALFGMTSDLNSNPSQGIYVRAPRLGESNFLRTVIRAGSTETTVTVSTIPYISGPIGYFQFSILIDMPNDTVRVFLNDGAGGNYFTHSYTSFLVNNPSFLDQSYFAEAGAVRNGTGAVPVAQSVVLDSFSISSPRNYKRNK